MVRTAADVPKATGVLTVGPAGPLVETTVASAADACSVEPAVRSVAESASETAVAATTRQTMTIDRLVTILLMKTPSSRGLRGRAQSGGQLACQLDVRRLQPLGSRRQSDTTHGGHDDHHPLGCQLCAKLPRSGRRISRNLL